MNSQGNTFSVCFTYVSLTTINILSSELGILAVWIFRCPDQQKLSSDLEHLNWPFSTTIKIFLFITERILCIWLHHFFPWFTLNMGAWHIDSFVISVKPLKSKQWLYSSTQITLGIQPHKKFRIRIIHLQRKKDSRSYLFLSLNTFQRS